MALDKAFFEAINIDLVKKKYYNAGKVNAVLEDIAAQAEELIAENAALRSQREALSGKTEEIGEALVAAQALARQIVEDAKAQARQIVRQAQDKAEEPSSQEKALLCVEASIARLKRQQAENIELLNQCWQDFLCGLDPEEESGAEEDELPLAQGELEQRVNAIARELKEIIGE